MSKPKKKRDKKYNPWQLKKLKVYKLQMRGEATEENRMVSMWQILNNKPSDAAPPMDLFLKLSKGDLAIALRKDLIPQNQSYHIKTNVHAVNDATGEAVDVEYELATPEKMTCKQFLNGPDLDNGDEPIYVKENGIKVRWEGLNKKLRKYLDEIAGDDFEVKK